MPIGTAPSSSGGRSLPWTIACLALSFSASARAADPAPDRHFGLGPGGPYKVTAADFTGDGVLDLAIGYHRLGVVTIERGDGQGNFERIAETDASVPVPAYMGGVYNLAHGDVDGDGRLDIAFSVHGDPPPEWKKDEVALDVLRPTWCGKIVVARNTGEGRLEKLATFDVDSQATGVTLADLDQDGRLDLLYTARGSSYRGDVSIGTLHIRRSLDGRSFGEPLKFPAGPSAYFVETGDLNGDSFPDVMVPNEHGVTVQTWLNPGRDLFEHAEKIVHRELVTTPVPNRRSHAINHVRAGDLTGDGKLDLVTANLGTSTVSVFAGNGDGTFQKDELLEGGENGAWLALGDLNGDGALDFAITHWTGDFLSVFLNQGRGQFAARKDYQAGSGTYGVTLADMDADGKLDAITCNYRDRTLSFLRGAGDGTFHKAVTAPKGLKRVEGRWEAERR